MSADYGKEREVVTSPNEIVEVLQKRYPNDALKVDAITDEKSKAEYVGKVKLIQELKVLMGVK